MKLIKTFESFQYYKTCDCFDNFKEKTICQKLNELKKWLVNSRHYISETEFEMGLGLKFVVNDILYNHKIIKDYNDEYQEAFEILSKIKTNDGLLFPDIIYSDGKYYHEKFKNTGIVKDENDQWHFVNKLNTNYSDLSELLTKVLVDLKLDYITKYDDIVTKRILLKNRKIIKDYIRNHFDIDKIKEFIRNTKVSSHIGEKTENYVKSVLEKFGMKTLYSGGNGDFIDMIFGIDLISEHDGKIILCQIKSNEVESKKSIKSKDYKRIDYFISPISGVGSDIIVYDKKEESFIINKNGELIK